MILVMSSGLYKAWVMVNYQEGGYLRTEIWAYRTHNVIFFLDKKKEA